MRPEHLSPDVPLRGQEQLLERLLGAALSVLALGEALVSLCCSGRGQQGCRRRSRAVLRGGSDARADTAPSPARATGGPAPGLEPQPCPPLGWELGIYSPALQQGYGTSGTHWGKNADSLYEFLMGEEERGRPQGELVKC